MNAGRIRGSRPHPTARVINAWEPVVYAGGRRNRREDPEPGAGGELELPLPGVRDPSREDVLQGVLRAVGAAR